MVRLAPLCPAILGLSLPALVSAVVDKWTPAGFNWDDLQVNHSHPSGLWVHKDHVPAKTQAIARIPQRVPSMVDTEGQELLSIPVALGIGFDLIKDASVLTTEAWGVYNSIKSCTGSFGGPIDGKTCFFSLLGTVVGFGASKSAVQDVGRNAAKVVMPHRVQADGTVDLEMNTLPYNKRDAEVQSEHDGSVYLRLRSLSTRDPEFLGYAADDHRLARRDFGLHPRVPMFRFDHPVLGEMEITTRDTLNGSYATFAHAGHPTHLLGRRQIAHYIAKRGNPPEPYDKERVTSHHIEARFDGEASRADPGQIHHADPNSLYQTFEPQIDCFFKDKEYWKGSDVLNFQMYDHANEGTFGFSSIGIFNTTDETSSLDNVKPKGMPLPQPKC